MEEVDKIHCIEVLLNQIVVGMSLIEEGIQSAYRRVKLENEVGLSRASEAEHMFEAQMRTEQAW